MYEPVEDAVGNGGIADLRVPGCDWQLAGQQRGPDLITPVTDLQKVAPLGFGQRAIAQSSTISRSIRLSRSSNLPWLPSALDMARSRNSQRLSGKARYSRRGMLYAQTPEPATSCRHRSIIRHYASPHSTAAKEDLLFISTFRSTRASAFRSTYCFLHVLVLQTGGRDLPRRTIHSLCSRNDLALDQCDGHTSHSRRVFRPPASKGQRITRPRPRTCQVL